MAVPTQTLWIMFAVPCGTTPMVAGTVTGTEYRVQLPCSRISLWPISFWLQWRHHWRRPRHATTWK